MKTFSINDSDTFYSPASDECWIELAKAIMESYTLDYINKTPVAYSQEEYDKLDEHSYALARRSILKHIKHGPLRHAINIKSAYAGLEKRRLERSQRLKIKWVSKYNEDIEKL